MPTEDPRHLLEQVVASFNDPARHEAYLAAYAPDVVLHGYGAPLPPGREGSAPQLDTLSLLRQLGVVPTS